MMLDGMFIVSLIGGIVQLIKENTQKTIPAENFANKELYYKDMVAGVSIEDRMKNLENGKYRYIKPITEPHRDYRTGKIIIEDSKSYDKDIRLYGAYRASVWVKQGKYNLSEEKLQEQHKRIDKHFEYLYSL